MSSVVTYRAFVRMDGGWRRVLVEAEIEPLRIYRSKVVRVVSVEGCAEGVITGVGGRKYFVSVIRDREVGKIKNNGSLDFGGDL